MRLSQIAADGTKRRGKRRGPGEGSGSNPGDANYRYVTQSGAGSNTGMDWANAYAGLPGTLSRGLTYYIADGSYGSYTFNDAVSGTTLITIKKATVADHGEDVSGGWSSTMGDGQASFTDWEVTTSYWLFDGQTKNTSNWFEGASYGFKVGTAGTQNTQLDISGSTAANIAVQYVWLAGRDDIPDLADGDVGAYALDTYSGGVTTRTGLRFSHMYVSHTNQPAFIRDTDGTILEYYASENTWGNDANHGNGVNLYYFANGANNAIIRYCHFRDQYMAGGGTSVISITGTSGHQIYGNLFERYLCGDACIGFDGGDASDMLIYNNTIVDGESFGEAINGNSGSGNVVRNNLLFNNVVVGGSSSRNGITVGSGATITHNAFNTGSTGTNAQTGLTDAIFVDYAGNNYRLESDTTAGVDLSSPYDTDMDGTTRESGAWSRGAFQYTGA